ncbi:hypothetical protein [Exiguobacterium oxidotolerans]|uniref:hypothetical protein n=1 Tax=Exiguobacterium oxidotolerans TaxID=223958 RepID=UPI000493E8F2|nr:hypothetical protein [Exiguobacterium oxidotolerans]
MFKDLIENITLFTFSVSLFALILSVWNFIKQHFSSEIIVYPVEEDNLFYLVIENIGNAKINIKSLRLKVIRHHQEIYSSHLSGMPIFRRRHELLIPGNSSYKFIVGDTHNHEEIIDVLPQLTLEVETVKLKYFRDTKIHNCDYGIFLKPKFMYEKKASNK